MSFGRRFERIETRCESNCERYSPLPDDSGDSEDPVIEAIAEDLGLPDDSGDYDLKNHEDREAFANWLLEIAGF